MRIKFPLVFGILLLLVTSAPVWAFDVDMTLSCPGQVTVGSPLNVTVANIENWDSAPVTLSRFATGFVVNGNNTVGGAGFYGPFVKKLALNKTIPAASDPMMWPQTPGKIANFSVNVGTAPNAPGTFAMAYVNFVSGNGQEITGESCMVSIVP